MLGIGALETELANLLEDPGQAEAYFAVGNCVVQAGPGSGKTALLALKVRRLLAKECVSPQGLACVTFNNEAVREFTRRLRDLGVRKGPNLFLGTVHAFCLTHVIRPFARIYDGSIPQPLKVASQEEQETILSEAQRELGIKLQPWRARRELEVYRRTTVAGRVPGVAAESVGAELARAYEARLRAQGYLDFDDLVLSALRLIEDNEFVGRCLAARYPWLVVDEYQDLGYPLHRIVVHLLRYAKMRVFAVGDPDQSIYGFAGADPRYLQDLAQRNDVLAVQLRLNYRCGQKIIDGAEVILAPESPRNYRAARGTDGPGEIIVVERPIGFQDQCKTLALEILPRLMDARYEPRDIATLYIDKHDAGALTRTLQEHNIPYSGIRDLRYERTPVTRWIEDVAQWCCGLRGRRGVRFEEIARFWSVLNRNAPSEPREASYLKEMRTLYVAMIGLVEPSRPLDAWLRDLDTKVGLAHRLEALGERPEDITAFKGMVAASDTGGALERYTVSDLAGIGPLANKMTVSTLHSSKGQQFDAVVILGLEEGRLPSWSAESQMAIREARRTFYVGLTRARHVVYLLYSGWYLNPKGTRFASGPSRFVLELVETQGGTAPAGIE